MAVKNNAPYVVAVRTSAGGRSADLVKPGVLSARYETIAGNAEDALAVLGHRLSEAYEFEGAW